MNSYKVPRKTIIEFMGLPGSGKSTIAREISAKIREQSKQCLLLSNTDYAQSWFELKFLHKSIARPLNILFGMFNEPRLSLYSYTLAAYSTPTNLVNISRGFHLVAWSRFFRKLQLDESLDMVVAEEGVLHSIGLICAIGRQPHDKIIFRILSQQKYIPQYVIVNLEVPINVSINRIQKRSNENSRFNSCSNIEWAKSFMLRYQSNMNQVLRLTKNSGFGSIVHIDGTMSPNSCAQEIINYLYHANKD